ncbi:hypothetical protein ON010_g2744 [Phytophthora cinnamomi]|nr:hypothetical protein ON010_g2744 [Phytophthora cinnamomi]
MEEVVFWKVIKNLLFDKDRVVIVGSPGVGKSCFLMLIAFYLACIEKKKVLVIRRLNQRKHMNAVAFLDGGGSYARLLDFSPNDILAIRHQAQVESAIVLVDGFTQGEVEDAKNGYMPFDVLATSCQFDAKQDDNSHIVVLAGWREADLLRYAKLTNWEIETGLRKTKQLNPSIWPKLVKEQYFYSGGSLREFCKERKLLKLRAVFDCCSVKNDQASELVHNYGGGQATKWMDCGVTTLLTAKTKSTTMILDGLEVYKYAKSVDAGLHGVAY